MVEGGYRQGIWGAVVKIRRMLKASHPTRVYRSATKHPYQAAMLGLLLASNAAWGIQYDAQSHAVKFVWGTQEKKAVAAQIEATRQVEQLKRREEFRDWFVATLRRECL